MSDQFRTDLRFEKQKDRMLLNAFYNYLCGKNNWFKVGKTLQDRGIDIVNKKTEEAYENKVRRKEWNDFALETESCSVKGYEKDGWMKYSEADWLMYGFSVEKSIKLYQIDFKKLKSWFWNNYFKYPEIITPQINKSKSRVVPIEDVKQFIKKRFHLTAKEKEKKLVTINSDSPILPAPPMTEEEKKEILEMEKRIFGV